MDVFYLIGLPSDQKARRKIQKKLHWLAVARYCKKVNIRKEWRNKPARLLKLFCGKAAFCLVPFKLIEKEFEKAAHSVPLWKSEYCTTCDIFANKNLYLTETLRETQILKTGIGELRVPVRYKDILRNEYGDYTKVPSLENRLAEVKSVIG